MRDISLLVISLSILPPAQANLGAIPMQSGWSGFVFAGVGEQHKKSHFDSGNGTQTQIDELTQADNTHRLLPIFNGDVRYSWANSRTQVFLGNLIEDAVRFDFTQQLGVRQELGNKGILAASLLYSAQPLEQWRDPFEVDTHRQTTDIRSRGGRVSWDQIWGTPFYGSISHRSITVDDEESGSQFDDATAATLARRGHVHALSLSYQWHPVPGYLVEPAILYRQADLDGRAHSNRRYGLQLTFAKHDVQWSLVSNLYGGKTRYAEANPIFEQFADANEVAMNGTFFWHRLFGLAPLSATVTASYARSDSKISFYDSRSTLFSSGLLYHF